MSGGSFDLKVPLYYINPAELEYQEWVNVGMALKHEGYDCSVWDEWSRNDSRYKPGVCADKWRTFNRHDLTGATITQMAKDRGWTSHSDDDYRLFDWDDEIVLDRPFIDKNYIAPETVTEPSDRWDRCAEIIEYINGMYDENEYVGFSFESFQREDGKYIPNAGDYTRTAGETIATIQKYITKRKKHYREKYDEESSEFRKECNYQTYIDRNFAEIQEYAISSTFGTPNIESGAWVRINPVDGNGVKDENVTGFRYALIESDNMPIETQIAMIRQMQMPVRFLIASGGKSVHAIVNVGANSMQQYRERVDLLHKICQKNGFEPDKSNRNPSRLSRIPGVYRKGKKQFIIDRNIGIESWEAWIDFINEMNDDLPDIEDAKDLLENLPPLAPDLIEGILRQGHKMLLAGPSKAGKSFLLINLAICIAEGRKWLEWNCAKGKVLYVNMEVDRASFAHRINDMYDSMHITEKSGNLKVWNLRGKTVPMDKLAPKLIRRAKDGDYLAIIIDPIYKIITGDENNASEMGQFCNQFDKIASELGCAVIYCHHHSKGAQSGKSAMDRASGSGVFARDPDALLDMLELEVTNETRLSYNEKNGTDDHYVTGWSISATLREYASPPVVRCFFDYPNHIIDRWDILKDVRTEDAARAGALGVETNKNKKRTKVEELRDYLDNILGRFAFADDVVEQVALNDVAEEFEVAPKTIKRWLADLHEYRCVFDRSAGEKGTAFIVTDIA